MWTDTTGPPTILHCLGGQKPTCFLPPEHLFFWTTEFWILLLSRGYGDQGKRSLEWADTEIYPNLFPQWIHQRNFVKKLYTRLVVYMYMIYLYTFMHFSLSLYMYGRFMSYFCSASYFYVSTSMLSLLWGRKYHLMILLLFNGGLCSVSAPY